MLFLLLTSTPWYLINFFRHFVPLVLLEAFICSCGACYWMRLTIIGSLPCISLLKNYKMFVDLSFHTLLYVNPFIVFFFLTQQKYSWHKSTRICFFCHTIGYHYVGCFCPTQAKTPYIMAYLNSCLVWLSFDDITIKYIWQHRKKIKISQTLY